MYLDKWSALIMDGACCTPPEMGSLTAADVEACSATKSSTQKKFIFVDKIRVLVLA